MIKDIMNKPYEINLEGESYTLDYDNKAYAELENLTGKGLFRIYDEFVIKNNLKYSDCIEIVCCGMLKNHTHGEIAKARITLNEKRFLFLQNIAAVTMAFMEPLTPPEILNVKEKKSKSSALKKKKK